MEWQCNLNLRLTFYSLPFIKFISIMTTEEKLTEISDRIIDWECHAKLSNTGSFLKWLREKEEKNSLFLFIINCKCILTWHHMWLTAESFLFFVLLSLFSHIIWQLPRINFILTCAWRWIMQRWEDDTSLMRMLRISHEITMIKCTTKEKRKKAKGGRCFIAANRSVPICCLLF